MVQGKWLVKLNLRFNPADYATILYAIITSLWILIFFNKIEDSFEKIVFRIGVILLIVLIFNIKSIKYNDILDFIKISYSSFLLVYWYRETASLNTFVFDPFDHYLFSIDQRIFGFQPSVEFSARYGSPIWSEIMYYGYFSYYFINMLAILLYFFKKKASVHKTVFIVIFSFIIYYIVFIIFPSYGPQFYLPYELRSVPNGFLLQQEIRYLLSNAEVRTGAFPSSHVGLALIFMILIFKISKKVFWVILPVSLILMASTVYIKAHYFIDVIAGLISGFMFYYISYYLYPKFVKARDYFIIKKLI
ncbi:MAG: phosphatase PAP2 family protein [Deltaproteobacteria bacterium]